MENLAAAWTRRIGRLSLYHATRGREGYFQGPRWYGFGVRWKRRQIT